MFIICYKIITEIKLSQISYATSNVVSTKKVCIALLSGYNTKRPCSNEHSMGAHIGLLALHGIWSPCIDMLADGISSANLS